MVRSHVFVLGIVVVVLGATMLTSADNTGDQVGWKSVKRGGLDPDSIKEKGRSLLGKFRQNSRTLSDLKAAEVKMDNSLTTSERDRRLASIEETRRLVMEAVYEIKQRIVDAIQGVDSKDDPDVPEVSMQMTNLFTDALFAQTYREETRNMDAISEIIKGLLSDV